MTLRDRPWQHAEVPVCVCVCVLTSRAAYRMLPGAISALELHLVGMSSAG